MGLLLGLVVLGALVSVTSTQDLTVTVQQGKLRGHKIYTHHGRSIIAFRGVPYAAPPVGDLRFVEPQPPAAWEGVRNARLDGSVCIQKDFIFKKNASLEGSEDCLFLNVYTTKLPKKKDVDSEVRPVMVYFHGGGWLSGHAGLQQFGPQYLLDYDVLLVTLNYRLGPLGFLSTEDAESPGNYGLKDQLAALHWVKANIAAFGGDSGCVTIFGQSAGGASVHYHLLSPLSSGLFHRAISQSGTALAPWASARQPAQKARRLARLLECPEQPSAKMLNCLRTKDAALIVEASEKFLEWNVDPLLVFSPSVEPPHSGQRLIPAPVLAMIREMGRHSGGQPVPWMTGFTSEDGSIRTAYLAHNDSLIGELDDNFDELGPITLRLKESASNPKDVAQKIRGFYFGKQAIDSETLNKLSEMYTDRQFLAPISQSVSAMTRFSEERPIFLYQFSYRGKHSLTSSLDPGSDTNYGVCHLDELQYLFNMPAFFPVLTADSKSNDTQMMKIMTQLWVDFALTGNPTPEAVEDDKKDNEDKDEDEDEELKNFAWRRATSNAPAFADLSLEPKMLGSLHEERIYFWEALDLLENGREELHRGIIIDHEEL